MARVNGRSRLNRPSPPRVYLTRRNRPVAAVIDSAQLEQLLEDAEELADIRAVDSAWKETERLSETPIPWEDVKRDLGLMP